MEKNVVGGKNNLHIFILFIIHLMLFTLVSKEHYVPKYFPNFVDLQT